ncbi:MAG: hypothetical protein OXC95_12070 [Dehalococcoidia bacterium]|nr:hypothetical protein [Dehalococcoidia bacterium]
MEIAELVTVVGVIAGVGGILIAMAVFTWQMVSSTNRFDAKLDRLDAKIEAQGKELEDKLEDKIEAQGKELGAKIEALTAETREMAERFSRKVTDVEIEQARLNAINEIMLDDRHTHNRADD